MKLPAMKGVIRRRILVNYRVDPEELAKRLPSRFRPKLHNGFGVAGICLIRLEHMRPLALPAAFGISSENAAHRAAVTWIDEEGRNREGVYISRRHTGSALNAAAGGRLFPGQQQKADFLIDETEEGIDLRMESESDGVQVCIKGAWAGQIPADSCFTTLGEASSFFEAGALGYSATDDPSRVDGLELRPSEWKIEPMAVESVQSSILDQFPPGTATFDCALAMRNVDHEWIAAEDLRL